MSTSPRQLGKYALQERLGSGGMAEVWKALDTQLQRFVALKLLHADLQNDPNFVTRFEREAQLIATLHHPNIIQIYDFHVSRPPETSDTLAYMVMDYVEGQTLAQYLRNTSHQGQFPSYPTLLQLFAPICLAVDYAHQKGMIHRDIKPSNILLDRRNTTRNLMGEPVLSDFGIARLLGTASTLQSGWSLGTPSYISPEQVSGAPGNERSDIYALSVILYEACTGTLPFQGDNPASVMMQHITTTPTAPILVNPHIPPALALTILRGLAKKPEDRFSSASALCIAMSEAINIALPEDVRQAVYQTADKDNPTFISPLPYSGPASNPQLPRAGDPPPTIIQQNTPSRADPARTPSLSPLIASSALTSSFDMGSGNTPSQAGQASRPVAAQAPQSAMPSTAPARPQRFNKRLMLRALLALVLVLASIGTLLFLTQHKSTPPPVARGPQVVGHAFFISSGQLNADNSRGINDEVLLDLQNVPAPASGKAYYAWLLGDKTLSEPAVTPLGRLLIDHGKVRLLYPGNQVHTNLLAIESRVLITSEDVNSNPSSFSPDDKDWVYYAQLSQAPSPKDKLHFSMLDHLRHLLSESPELKIRGLHGGLDMWFLRNTQKILEWANAARDGQNSPDLLHRQIVRILDYLDGPKYVQKDVPAVGSALLVDAQAAQVPLLGPPPADQDPPGYAFSDEPAPGYVYLVSSHLAGTVLSPDATQDQRDLAQKVHVAIDQVKGWLEQVHQDAKQLIVMNADQLGQPQTLSLLDDMVTQAQHAYDGEIDPLNGQLQGGAIWVCSNIQRIANFDLKPYKPGQ